MSVTRLICILKNKLSIHCCRNVSPLPSIFLYHPPKMRCYNTLDFIKVLKLVQTEDALNASTQLPCCYSALKCFVKPHLCSLSELSFDFSIVKQDEMKLNVRVTVATFIFCLVFIILSTTLTKLPCWIFNTAGNKSAHTSNFVQ